MDIPNIAVLPALPLPQRGELPDLPGVYFALGANDEVLYIGKAVSLCNRWKSTGHHRYKQLMAMPGVRLAWLAISTPDLLDAVEEACIKHFRPVLNGTRGIDRVRPREVVLTLPRPIWNALEEEVNAMGLQGVHGVRNKILLRWIASHLRSKGWLK